MRFEISPSPVRAVIATWPEMSVPAFVMNCLAPSMTHSPSSRRARVFDVAGVLPASGSVRPNAPSLRPAQRSGRQRCLLLVGAEQVDRLRAERRVRAHRDRDARVHARELLDRERVGERVAARAAVLLRERDAHRARARRASRRSRTGSASRGRAPRRPARPRCGRSRGRSRWMRRWSSERSKSWPFCARRRRRDRPAASSRQRRRPPAAAPRTRCRPSRRTRRRGRWSRRPCRRAPTARRRRSARGTRRAVIECALRSVVALMMSAYWPLIARRTRGAAAAATRARRSARRRASTTAHQASSLLISAGEGRAERGDDPAREGRDVDEALGPEPDRVREAVAEHEAALGVGVVDLDRRAVRGA